MEKGEQTLSIVGDSWLNSVGGFQIRVKKHCDKEREGIALHRRVNLQDDMRVRIFDHGYHHDWKSDVSWAARMAEYAHFIEGFCVWAHLMIFACFLIF
ncbi:hypothetical protein Y032_0168g202 [Ancylostoma ceylanicum]|nr:hypothetical protein Y032_0168g202 [Ancylostoma ceylanicum]